MSSTPETDKAQSNDIDVFHVAGELITEFWSFSEQQAETDAFWFLEADNENALDTCH